MKRFHQNPVLRMLGMVALLFSFLLISGCNGCRSNLDEDEAAKKKEEEKKKKKKPDFATRTPVLLPGLFPNPQSDDTDEKDGKDPLQSAMANLDNPVIRFNRTKLGHWITANFQAIANNYDADGELSVYCMNAMGRPVGIPSTDYYLSTTRPVSLPKGEWKNLETTVFLPRRQGKVSIANVHYGLQRSIGGLTQISLPQPTALMKPFQHHIVLLSDRPDNYNYLKLTDTVQLRGQQLGNGEMVPPFYYVVPSIPGNPSPLPRHGLSWTTIAYLIWDDYDPDRISQEQQDAILDWLHFGGQIIVSGPDSLDDLQFSFLGKYLPAEFSRSRNITNADLTELNQYWTVPVSNKEAEKKIFRISDQVPLLGAEFAPHQDAEFVTGTGELAIERQIGRGRIVATAFSLSAPAVRKWRSFPSFLHNALLRKPARRFGKTVDMDISFGWMDDRTSIFDPMLGTTLRYLSRDLSPEVGTPKTPAYSLIDDMSPNESFSATDSVLGAELQYQLERAKSVTVRNETDHWHFGGYADAPQSGCGGWNDDSGVSIAARETLREAAGITPPSSGFVLKMLIAYLAVLVPINWLVFRLMGRIEWAWIAAPIIAIVGAIVVVKMASLDIGFVRSNTQIGLLEIHADYPRGHATEYSALYTSLSTRYDVDLDNSTAQSLPFARTNSSDFYQEAETLSQVNLRRTVQNRLEGFQIQSNFTGLLHTESMLDLEGIISCSLDDQNQPDVVSNGSFLDLSNAGVAWRDGDGKYRVAWIGDLPAGDSSDDLDFEATSKDAFADRWRQQPVFSSSIRSATEIWGKHFGGGDNLVTMAQLSEIAELQSEWDRFQQLLAQIGSVDPSDQEPSYSRADFCKAFQAVYNDSSMRLGRIFDVIAQGLQLAPGEVRLFGTTEQRLGRTRFDPEATQTEQQTLVVVHLKQPALPVAKRDDNSMTDFISRSNLDWEDEMRELNQ